MGFLTLYCYYIGIAERGVIEMGTDVYLNWKGMTKKEKEAQYCGWDIEKGKSGYLRASIGMFNENTVLRTVFPDNWQGEKPYDFLDENNLTKLELSARTYLLVVMFGEEILHEKMQPAVEMGKVIESVFKDASSKSDNKSDIRFVMPKTEDLYSAICWLKSLYEFYYLGCEKQKDGKKPQVYISW